MKHKTGYFHSVETFGTVDGPGMRYVLFLSGCRLGCVFCHNRDTWNFGSQSVSVEAVLADIEKYRGFYDASGGGLTVSGGEPLLQPEFVAALFAACRERGIHTTLDTAGCCPAEALTSVLPYTDLVLFSIKSAIRQTHIRLTGQADDGISGNLQLAAQQKPLIVRYVVIPGITGTEPELTALARLVTALPSQPPVELLAYHQTGRQKWDALSLDYPLDGTPAATAADLEWAGRVLTAHGVFLSGCR